MVIGLEVHCELGTKTKIFCGCPTTFGAQPNTQCCPVCMGMPGTLPVLNEQVVEYAIKAGMATNCTIARCSKQDRKNYFYPDLPKAYQISQYDLPLCENGWLEIESENGTKKIGITRIHIEEDAGKLIHNDRYGTMVDCNRCGVPLIEIVSEPDIRSAEEAVAYFKKLRSIILYTGISDCKMQEGSMRCDINLSVRKKGTKEFGTRTEMKNLNSFTFIQKAIEYEYARQVYEIENGGVIVQETMRFDQASGKTFSMRKKEDANDYRYFPDPDLAPIVMSEDKLNKLKDSIPTLPDERKKAYIENYGITSYDAELITSEMSVADYFESAAKNTKYPKLLANIVISEIIKLADGENGAIAIEPLHLAQIADMQGSGEINSSVAKKVIKALWDNDEDACEYVKKNNLGQINDENVLNSLINEAIERNPKSVQDYKKGKVAAAKAIMGQVMGATKGRGNPLLIERLLNEALEALK
ncbi:MAG: Asp-tRNA(Asn)/Glu-tRNA(Gln) amidotransferase subunit GatB [Clostridia bacterium]|nr:Asp-tRNA(Asn)/Glu-tRNA(Gln) amidotransferase subunit GatB [Clostridia bacterium]